MSEIMLSVRDVSKRFGAVHALDQCAIRPAPGEVHALMGENGAGKSTLMNILGGVLQPDAGQIELKGKPYVVDGPAAAQKRGIGLVHQEIALCPDITVAENIFMSETNARGGFWMETSNLKTRAEKALAGLHPVPATALVGDLPIASQQIVEIAKALTLNCDVLIFDEPTAALTETESNALFEIIRGLKARGMGIIYISHRMAEIFSLSDRITVFRDGAFVETLITTETTPEEVATKMVGRPLLDLYPPRSGKPPSAVCLAVDQIADGHLVKDVSLEVRPGEILGLAGLIGSGRTETVLAICGLSQRTNGEIRFDGREYPASRLPRIDKGRHRLSQRGSQRAQACSSISRSPRTFQRSICAVLPASLFIRSRDENAVAEEMRDRLGHTLQQRGPGGQDIERRQPAESGAGQTAGRQAHACCSSMSRPAASISAPRPRSTPSCAAWPMKGSRSWPFRPNCPN